MATCHWHPDRETGLHCGNCEKAICVECMRQHPVGIRCKECSGATRLPTFDVSPNYLARGIGAALALGVGGAIGLPLLIGAIPFLGFFSVVLMIGAGYIIGEGVSAAVNRRRGRPYQFMALGGTVLATGALALGSGSVFALLGGAIAAYVAWSRLAP